MALSKEQLISDEQWSEFFALKSTEPLGDTYYEVRNEIVTAYVPTARGMAHSIMKKLAVSNTFWRLVFDARHFGTIRAVETFDPDRGTDFEGWLHSKIVGALLDAKIAFSHETKTASSLRKSLDRATMRLEHRLLRSPTAEELSLELSWAPEELSRTQYLLRRYRPISLEADRQRRTKDNTAIIDRVAAPGPFSDDIMRTLAIALPSAMEQLRRFDEKFHHVVVFCEERGMHKGSGSGEALAKLYDVSPASISNWRNRGLSFLALRLAKVAHNARKVSYYGS